MKDRVEANLKEGKDYTTDELKQYIVEESNQDFEQITSISRGMFFNTIKVGYKTKDSRFDGSNRDYFSVDLGEFAKWLQIHRRNEAINKII